MHIAASHNPVSGCLSHWAGYNRLSSLELSCHLGVKYDTAWLLRNKILRAMTEREDAYVLWGKIKIDDAYLGVDRPGGRVGRGSEIKIPIRYSRSPQRGRPADSPHNHAGDWLLFRCGRRLGQREPGSWWRSALGWPGPLPLRYHGKLHSWERCYHWEAPQRLAPVRWINTLLGNFRSTLRLIFHAFNNHKHAKRFLGGYCFRFNRGYLLSAMTILIANAVCFSRPCTELDLGVVLAYG